MAKVCLGYLPIAAVPVPTNKCLDQQQWKQYMYKSEYKQITWSKNKFVGVDYTTKLDERQDALSCTATISSC